jgi:hypothetical protein
LAANSMIAFRSDMAPSCENFANSDPLSIPPAKPVRAPSQATRLRTEPIKIGSANRCESGLAGTETECKIAVRALCLRTPSGTDWLTCWWESTVSLQLCRQTLSLLRQEHCKDQVTFGFPELVTLLRPLQQPSLGLRDPKQSIDNIKSKFPFTLALSRKLNFLRHFAHLPDKPRFQELRLPKSCPPTVRKSGFSGGHKRRRNRFELKPQPPILHWNRNRLLPAVRSLVKQCSARAFGV